jgi:sensor domain CHASE-containing protein/signal transduction histidine kinase
MDLREKTLLSLIGALMLILIGIIIFSSTILLGSYENLEASHVSDTLDLTLNNVNNEIANLNAIVTDWGPWDDAYTFVKGQKSDFINVNLREETYASLRLNFVIITDTNGTIVYGEGFDATAREMTPLSSGLVRELANADSPLRNTTTGKKVSGFLNLPEGPVIITAHPVLHTDFSGPPAGMVIMGRDLNDEEISRLGMLTLPSLSIIPLASSPLPPDDRDLLLKDAKTPVHVHIVNDRIVEGHRVIQDIYGNDAFLLKVEMPRDIFQQGRNTVFAFILIQLASGLLIGLLIIYIMDRGVLSRISTISTDFRDIAKRGDVSARISVNGNDELSRFAEVSNRMLETIETTQKALQENEAKLHSIFDGSPVMQFVIGKDHRIILWNRSLEEYSGISAKDVVGTDQQWRAFYATKRPCLADLLVDGAIEKIPQWYQGKFRQSQFIEDAYEATDFFLGKGTAGKWLYFTAAPVRDIRGVIIGAVETLEDITERKKAEEAIKVANIKLNLLSSIIRHDILNQLTALRVQLELGKMQTTDPVQLDAIKKEEAAVETISQQIEFTRDYQEMGVQAPQWQDVHRTILQAISRIHMEGITIKAELGTLEIYADALLERVFYNLFENSIRHGIGLTTITVSYRESGDGCVVLYEDNGGGIPQSQKENIFNRKFFNNTGFGMFLSREILSITGLTIKETGEPGKGVRFEISVPAGAYRFSGRT